MKQVETRFGAVSRRRWTSRIILVTASTCALLASAAFGWLLRSDEEGEPEMTGIAVPKSCRDLVFEGAGYVVCTVDPKEHSISLHLRGVDGKAFGSLSAMAKVRPFLFAMNAGMYHADLSPVGLYVDHGVEVAPLNLDDGEGNFFLKPNGVFYVNRAGRAGVIESSVFAASRPDVWMATQSGPMLVIEGAIHPRFQPNGASRHTRNGVGVRDDGVVAFAISRDKVSLGSFARLFRDELGCPNALFFDGAISALHDGTRNVVGGGFPAGPMVSASEPPGSR